MPYRGLNQAFADNVGVAHAAFDQVVVVELPPAVGQRRDVAAAFVTAANLLARIFHRVHLVGDATTPIGPNPWHMTTCGDLLAPLQALSEGEVAWGAPEELPDVVLSVGAPASVEAHERVWIDFARWRIGLDTPVSDRSNPGDDTGVPNCLAGLLASCWGASQVFLIAAARTGATLRPMPPFTWEAFPSGTPVPRAPDLGEIRMAGVGAVGCALVWALGFLDEITGQLDLIDDDCVDDGNLHRYLLMRAKDVDVEKPFVAEAALSHLDLDAWPRVATYQQFCTEHGYDTPLLLTPVDSQPSRRKLATTLPKRVLNAATGNHNVTISTHGFGGGEACLHCLYVVRDRALTTESRIAEALGLPIELVTEHLEENKPMDADVVAAVEQSLGVEAGMHKDWVGRRIQSFYQHAVCGSASFRSGSEVIVAPLSFISAAAGFLLAAELVLEGTSRAHNYRRLDLFHPPTFAFQELRKPDPAVRCICDDEDYRHAYRAKYGIDPAAQRQRSTG